MHAEIQAGDHSSCGWRLFVRDNRAANQQASTEILPYLRGIENRVREVRTYPRMAHNSIAAECFDSFAVTDLRVNYASAEVAVRHVTQVSGDAIDRLAFRRQFLGSCD